MKDWVSLKWKKTVLSSGNKLIGIILVVVMLVGYLQYCLDFKTFKIQNLISTIVLGY